MTHGLQGPLKAPATYQAEGKILRMTHAGKTQQVPTELELAPQPPGLEIGLHTTTVKAEHGGWGAQGVGDGVAGVGGPLLISISAAL